MDLWKIRNKNSRPSSEWAFLLLDSSLIYFKCDPQIYLYHLQCHTLIFITAEFVVAEKFDDACLHI